jgi:transcriptional regulator with XRE-family HTH domain
VCAWPRPRPNGNGTGDRQCSVDRHHRRMEDQRVGAVFRAVRIKRRWRQVDVAAAAKLSRGSVSRVERGHFDTLSLRTIRIIAAALDIRLDLLPRRRGGDLDRMLNARHSALHERVARMFRGELPDWVLVPEVSFSVWGERGVIDLLAWHPDRRALLVTELKTDIADANELVGTMDRKRRLAAAVARERGWDPATVSVWVIVSASRTNRRRLAAHSAMFRAAFPADGRSIGAWLRRPVRPIAAMSTWRDAPEVVAQLASIRRVRAARKSVELAKAGPLRAESAAIGTTPGR